LSLIAPTPGHLRNEKIDEFPIRKRAEDPGVMSANKTPAIRDKAIHRIANHEVGVSAEINAIVLGPTRYVLNIGQAEYNIYIMTVYIGVERLYGTTQDV
jgi:hypothetical protein